MRYSPEAAAEIQNHFSLVRQELQDLWVSLIRDIGPELKVERAREFVLQGVCRRLNIIQRCIRNIFSIVPVDRTRLMNNDERADVGINLHAFLINIHGVPDNLAWAYLLERRIILKPHRVGLFNTEHTQLHLPQEVQDYLKSSKIIEWHRSYAKNFRDALTHRIPPYIAPYVLTPGQQEKYQQLEEKISQAETTGAFDRALALTEEQDACGSICMAFSQSFLDKDACAPALLHPQVLADARTVMEIITVLRPHLSQSNG